MPSPPDISPPPTPRNNRKPFEPKMGLFIPIELAPVIIGQLFGPVWLWIGEPDDGEMRRGYWDGEAWYEWERDGSGGRLEPTYYRPEGDHPAGQAH